jgi:serine/threonine protein phosphatase 1
MIELEDYYIVHAGLRPGIGIRDQSETDRLWIRDSFIFSDYDFGKKIIFGHTPFSFPFIMDNKIGLDTGAVYGNKLTCLEIPSGKFHSVEA